MTIVLIFFINNLKSLIPKRLELAIYNVIMAKRTPLAGTPAVKRQHAIFTNKNEPVISAANQNDIFLNSFINMQNLFINIKTENTLYSEVPAKTVGVY